jgi:hypothetical protein
MTIPGKVNNTTLVVPADAISNCSTTAMLVRTSPDCGQKNAKYTNLLV